MLKLEVLPAQKGDCLLLHYGSEEEPKLAVIDGGPGGVYEDHLAPRLGELREERQLSDGKPLSIDLLMVSHVDDDHVNGILALANAMFDARRRQEAQLYRPLRLWHNSFDDLIGNSVEETGAALTAQFGPAGFAADQVPDDADIDEDALHVLASLGQGHELRRCAKELGWSLNPEFGGKLVEAGVGTAVTKTLDNMTLTVVGPLPPEIAALRKAHVAWIAARNAKRSEAQALIAAFKDSSVANLSSIVVLAEDGKRRILLTGDARGDKVLKGLEAAKRLPKDGTLHVDVLKVPHHGSNRNAAPEFFQRIHADTYVFSGNGEHGNPNRETIKMLLDARPEGGYTLHFTYPISTIDETRREFATRHEKPFDVGVHDLASLIDDRTALGVAVVQDGKPVII